MLNEFLNSAAYIYIYMTRQRSPAVVFLFASEAFEGAGP